MVSESKVTKQGSTLITLTGSAKISNWYQITLFQKNEGNWFHIGDIQERNLYHAYTLYEDIN